MAKLLTSGTRKTQLPNPWHWYRKKENEKVQFQSPQNAYDMGVAMIHQELDLVPTMDVTGNLFLGREIMKGPKWLRSVDRKEMRRQAKQLLNRLGFNLNPTSQVSSLSVAQQQLLLIARAVSINAKIIIMDEPTSSLSSEEMESLFGIIDNLKKHGASIIYISHYLEEVFRVSDRITVLRNGEKVMTAETPKCTIDELVFRMIGNQTHIDKKFFRDNTNSTNSLVVDNLTQKKGIVKNASFELKKGEILGIAGAVGAGRTELVKMIYGAEPRASGSVEINGKTVNLRNPKDAVAKSMALVPEERKREGLILRRSVFDNITIVALNKFRRGIIRYKPLVASTDSIIKSLGIVCKNQKQNIISLSGGNQQKCVLGRWLTINPDIIIMDQPTRGVDVGAKQDIYELINELAKNGTSIILVSDELEEIINLSDRILVMKKGKIIDNVSNENRDVNKSDLLHLMVS